MDRQIRIRITHDGKVEIDSSVYSDCKEVARHLTKNLGQIESFSEKDEVLGTEIAVKLESGD